MHPTIRTELDLVRIHASATYCRPEAAIARARAMLSTERALPYAAWLAIGARLRMIADDMQAYGTTYHAAYCDLRALCRAVRRAMA